MQTSNLPTEKVDAETTPRSIKDTDILQPLQFLVAARRGVQMDPSFSAINIPEDRYITYNGDSGFESQSSRTPFWIRCVIALGYMHNVSKIGLVFVVFAEAMNISRDTMRDSPKELKRKPLLQDVLWSSYWTVGAILLLFLSRVYAKRHMAKRIPPHLDPLSYQSQFKSALDEQGWQYREIVGRSLKDMEKIWSKDRSQVERFRVEGLMDPPSDRAYDVVVILRKEGKVQMSFRAPEEGMPLPAGIVLTIADK
ncbi:uncharacterized protein N7484_008827 [Penicillium longicatenatum]|uniref:uncharacterized protein n=1 Tax=Penicillium longicatenatum TaxID=1561947 RepID=UPI002547112D|nr:uncharacterized protein N7484_008827 [Penicillium longicatenatum]KAJ5635514.1 hypothetical protein N7484_008827 [Penicillium longicatenatum]